MCCKGKIYPGFLRLSIKKNVKLFYEFLKSDYILRSCSRKHGLKKTYLKLILPVSLLLFFL